MALSLNEPTAFTVETMAPFTDVNPTVSLPPEDDALKIIKELDDLAIQALSVVEMLSVLIDLVIPYASVVVGVVKTILSVISGAINIKLEDDKAKVELSKIQNITAIINMCEVAIEYQTKIIKKTLSDVKDCEDLAAKTRQSLLKFRNAMNLAFNAAMQHFDNISHLITQILDSVESSTQEIIHNLERAKVHILEEQKRVNVERLLSRLRTVYSFFIAEAKQINSLPLEQRLEKLERSGGILFYLDTALLGGKPGTMVSLLKGIIDDKLAYPTGMSDQLGLAVFRLLCFGVQMYSFMVMFKVQQTTLLAKTYYHYGDHQKFKDYIGKLSGTFKDHVPSLTALSVQVDTLIREIEKDPAIDKNADFDAFANATLANHKTIRDSLLKASSAFINQEGQAPRELSPILFIKEITHIEAPINDWLVDSSVTYAAQLLGENSASTLLGPYSDSSAMVGYASPVVQIGPGDTDRVRVIFRIIDTGKPQMVAILPNSNFTVFTDLTRDLYNSAHEPNRELSLRNTKIYLEQGAKAGTLFDDGYSALHWAAENNNWEVAHELIKNGSSTEVHNYDGFTPLLIASQKGYLDFVANLLEHGANVSATANEANHRLTPLHTAAANGFDSTVQLLIKQASIDLNARSVEGFTPLHYAATFNQDKVAATLLAASGVEIEAQSDKLLFTPLHVAAIHDSDKVAEILIDSGKVNIESKAFEDNTALHLAALHGSKKVVDILLKKGANVLANLSDKSIPLHMAAFGGYNDIISSLIQKHKDDNHPNIDLFNDDEVTPLYIAMQFDNQEAGNLLKKDGGADVDILLKSKTLLHVAAQKGHLTAAINLLEAGITVKIRDLNQLTALSHAVKNNFVDIANEILDHGGDVNYIGDLPLIHTVVDLDEYDALNMVQMFANHNAILNIANRKEPYNTFFHVVCAKGMVAVAQFLHSQGVRIDEKNKDGKTALDLAKENKQNEVVEYLESLQNTTARRRRDVSEVEQMLDLANDREEALDFSQSAKQVASSAAKPVGLINQAIGSLVSTLRSLPVQLSNLVSFKVDKFSSSARESAFHSVQSPDLNSTLLLLDVLIRRHSGERYVDTTVAQSVSPHEARALGLSLVDQLDNALTEIGDQSGEEVTEFNLFDFYRSVERLLLSGRYDQIEPLMHSTAREAFAQSKIESNLIDQLVSNLWTQICAGTQHTEPNLAAMHSLSHFSSAQTAPKVHSERVLITGQNLI